MKQENTEPKSASQRQTKHVKVSDLEHKKINDTVQVLASLFCKKAKALGIKVSKRGKYRNVPGQVDAVKCLLSGQELDTYIEKLIHKARGAV